MINPLLPSPDNGNRWPITWEVIAPPDQEGYWAVYGFDIVGRWVFGQEDLTEAEANELADAFIRKYKTFQNN